MTLMPRIYADWFLFVKSAKISAETLPVAIPFRSLRSLPLPDRFAGFLSDVPL